MNAYLGDLAVKIAFVALVYGLVVLSYGLYKKDSSFIKSGRRAQIFSTLFIIVASGILLNAFIQHDFSIRYVYEYSSTDLPIFYLISAFWGGQAGSLLLWLLILSVYAAYVVYKSHKSEDPIHLYSVAVTIPIQLLFGFLLVFYTNPFETVATSYAEGLGLNPMLQNPGMVIHPPAVYLGYVGFAIPFAYALAALILDRRDTAWISLTRKWTIFAWLFLTIGNIWGGQWAYEELGWGGYWAWDPVENASLLPWITGTAFLHSVMIQERKNLLKTWNIALVVITFELTILGTFLTRSGVLASVHAFSGSDVGRFFLIFIGLSVFVVIFLIGRRKLMLRENREIEALLSRESSFLINNLLFVALAFAVLWGTFFPLISEFVTGSEMSIGPSFFNKISTPIGLLILVLMGICPLISWSRASWGNFTRNFLFPLLTGILAIATALLFGVKGIALPIAIFASGFVVASILLEVIRGVRARQRTRKETLLDAFMNLFIRQRRRYGGYIIHLGVVMLLLGIIVHNTYSFKVQEEINIGESIDIGKYQLKAVDRVQGRKGNAEVYGIELELLNGNKKIGTLKPVKAFYATAEQPTSEPAIDGNFFRDIYVILDRYTENGFTIAVYYNPFVPWIWTSLYLMIIGTLVAIAEPIRGKR